MKVGTGQTSHTGCFLCVAAREQAAPAPKGTVVVVVDDLVALIEAGTPGVLVAPRSHVDGMAASPVDAGVVLGALRRAAATVQASYGVSGASIEPTTELSGAAGHVCYRVVPTVGDLPVPAGSEQGIDPQDLAAALHRAVAEHDTPPPG
ncbi:MAG: hypothetical protein ACRDYZ_11605 [Acidimicrobiales bacterium]